MPPFIRRNTAVLLALALLLLLVQPATPLLSLLGRGKENKKEKEQQGKKKEDSSKTTTTAAAAAAALPVPADDPLLDAAAATDADGKPADWTRSQQQHQRPGRRRLETQHEPAKLTLDEAQDWPGPLHVKRRLAGGEARDEKSAFFHRVAEAASVPPHSALRRKESEAGDKGEDAAGLAASKKAGEGMMNGSEGKLEQEFKLFDHFHRLKRREQAQQQMGV